jgi:prepilin-type N-terminal cleavage/methylation domain-containing protein
VHADVRGKGFTLIEVIVALAIGGIVVLLAHQLFIGVSDGVQRLAAARIGLDREANSRRLLAALAGSVEVGPPGAGGFEGEPERMTFSTWFIDVDGWPEPRRVAVEHRDSALVATGLTEHPLQLRDSVMTVAFDYLLDHGTSAAWVHAWQSPTSAPLAIRVRVTRLGMRRGADPPRQLSVDTLLLLVGPRG